MSTFFNAPSQTMEGGGLSSHEDNDNTKRNKKAQALNALLSASALGLFLEGCDGGYQAESRHNNIYDYLFGNTRITDSDTSGTGTMDARDANLVLFNFGYNSPDQFIFTRLGENLIVDTAPPDGASTISVRVEIVDYFLRPSAFVFAYNITQDLVNFTAKYFNVPSSVLANTETPPDESNVQLIIGGTRNGEELSGGDNREEIYGGGGDDTINGEGGADFLVGGAGADILNGGEGNDYLAGGEDTDTLDGGKGDDTLYGGAGADTYLFNEGDGEDEVLDYDYFDEGVVNILKFVGDYQASDFSYARSSQKKRDLVITVDTDEDGQAENEITIERYFVSDTSLDPDHNIRIQINDEEAFVPPEPPPPPPPATSAREELGNLVQFNLTTTSYTHNGVRYYTSDGSDFSVSGGVVTTDSGVTLLRDPPFVQSSEAIFTSSFADTSPAQPIVFFAEDDSIQGEGPIVGSDRGEYIVGGDADQPLKGRGGNDILEGRGGNDTLDGGEGTDSASYANSDTAVIVDLSAGTSDGGDAEGDTLVSIENLVGSAHDDSLTGDAEANALYGLAGADTLEGKGGDDLLNGGAGADTYVFGEGDGADTIVEVAEEGVVNTLRFEGNYEASDFSFAHSSEDGTDLVLKADTDGDGQAENEITLDGYFVSETSLDTVYSIELQINNEEAFVPSVEG